MILAVHFMYINAYFEIKNMKSSIDKSLKIEFLQTSHVYHDQTLTCHLKNFLIIKRKKIEGCGFYRIEDYFK